MATCKCNFSELIQVGKREPNRTLVLLWETCVGGSTDCLLLTCKTLLLFMSAVLCNANVLEIQVPGVMYR